MSVPHRLPAPAYLASSSSFDFVIPLTESLALQAPHQPLHSCSWPLSWAGPSWVSISQQPLRYKVVTTAAIRCWPQQPRNCSKMVCECYKMYFPWHMMQAAHVHLQLNQSSHLCWNPPSPSTFLQTHSPPAQPLHSLKSI